MPRTVPEIVNTFVEAASRVPWVGLLVRALTKSEKDLARDLSASIAFFTLLSLMPLLLGIIAIGSFFLDSAEIQARVSGAIVQVLPVSLASVTGNLESLVRLRGAAGLVSIVLLMWSASKMVGALTRGVNAMLGLERPYAFYMSPLRNIGITFSVAILALLATALMPVIGFLGDFELAFLGSRWNGFFQVVGSRAASFALSAILIGAVYTMIPFEKPLWKDLVVGVLVTALLIEVGKVGFDFYVSNASSLDALYGSLSSVIVLLIWLYYYARVMLYGAEIIREYRVSSKQQ
jgi:membrane protein